MKMNHKKDYGKVIVYFHSLLLFNTVAGVCLQLLFCSFYNNFLYRRMKKSGRNNNGIFITILFLIPFLLT